MNRNEMVAARKEVLNTLSDEKLVKQIVLYFENNRTMPGEKDLKDRAGILLKELEEGTISGVTSEIRKDLVEEFASVLVKETKLIYNPYSTRKFDRKDPSELPMTLTDSMPIGNNTMKDTYELPVTISIQTNQDKSSFAEAVTEAGQDMGMIPEGFQKNHSTIAAMGGTIIATDFSNGNLRNMSYKLVIDLGQTMDDMKAA